MIRSIVVALFVLLALCRPVAAQGAVEREVPPSPAMTEAEQKMAVARSLLRQNNAEGAALMLETLYEANPSDQNLVNLLRACYQQLKRYPKLELLDRRLIASYPTVFGYRLDLAEVLAEQGQLDSARVAYGEAVRTIPNNDRSTIQMIIQSQVRHGLTEAALKLIDSVRIARSAPSLYALERGAVMESQKKYGDATREYLPLLAQDTTRESVDAQHKVLLLLEFPDASAEVEKLLADHTKTDGSPAAVRLLADFYIRAGRFDQAFTYCLRRDTLEGLTGASPSYFMRQCSDRKLYSQVIRMGEQLTARRTSTGLVGDGVFLFAGALAQLGQYDRARACYDSIAAKSPNPADKADAMYAIGMIYFDRLADYGRALRYFDSVVTKFPRGLAFINAQRTAPYCYLRMGEIDSAEEKFLALATQPLTPDFDEEVAFNLAEIRFFRKEFDTAKVMLKRLMVDYPQGFYVNDALQLLMVLDDAAGNGELLGAYASALWYEERHLPDSCRLALVQLATASDRTLADDALYRLAQVDLERGDTSLVLEDIDSLTTAYPESYYRPYGLKLQADILSERPATLEQAKSLYKQVLEQCPNCPFGTEIRRRLRQMETDARVG
jgi:tetratricopeptide (TPR) repeat protein